MMKQPLLLQPRGAKRLVLAEPSPPAGLGAKYIVIMSGP